MDKGKDEVGRFLNVETDYDTGDGNNCNGKSAGKQTTDGDERDAHSRPGYVIALLQYIKVIRNEIIVWFKRRDCF